MITIGVDFSRRSSVYSVLDKEGNKIKRSKLENKPELISKFFDDLPEGPKQLTMEAGRSWGLYYEAVKDHVDIFHLAHPAKMRAITSSETKNDANDADMIAKLTYSGFLPKAHISSLGTRQLRSLVRFRYFWIRKRTALRCQVQTLLDRNLWPSDRPGSFKNPFCKKGQKWMRALDLAPTERFILNQCIDTYNSTTADIIRIESLIGESAQDLEGLKYLRTVPGFRTSKVHIYAVLLETDDITRFRKARHFAHYSGLIPKEHSSGERHITGRLVKGANQFLKTAIIEATWSALLTDKTLKAYYLSVKTRRGTGPAIIATSRKLCYAIYHVLKDRTVYRPVTPATAPVGPDLS